MRAELYLSPLTSLSSKNLRYVGNRVFLNHAGKRTLAHACAGGSSQERASHFNERQAMRP